MTGTVRLENRPPKWHRRPRWTRCSRGARGWAGASARWKGAPRVPAAAPQRGGVGGVEGGEGASAARFRVNFRCGFGDFPDALLRLCAVPASQRVPPRPRPAQGSDPWVLRPDPALGTAHPLRRIRAVPGDPSKKAITHCQEIVIARICTERLVCWVTCGPWKQLPTQSLARTAM